MCIYIYIIETYRNWVGFQVVGVFGQVVGSCVAVWFCPGKTIDSSWSTNKHLGRGGGGGKQLHISKEKRREK